MNKEYAQYLLKKTREDYNLIAEEFSSKRQEPWLELKFLFNDYLMPGDRVLDLGCGNGRLLQIFKDINIDYVGIDNSERLIEMARKKYPTAKFQVANALNLPFTDNHFDKVYSIAVFHHIPSKDLRDQYLREVKRVLKPGGIFVATVWNLWQWTGWKANIKYFILKILGLSKLDFKDVLVPWAEICQRYIHSFTKKELIILIEKAGFRVKESGIIKRQAKRGSNIYIAAEKQ